MRLGLIQKVVQQLPDLPSCAALARTGTMAVAVQYNNIHVVSRFVPWDIIFFSTSLLCTFLATQSLAFISSKLLVDDLIHIMINN